MYSSLNEGFMVIGIIQIGTFWLLACYPRRLPKKSATAQGFGTIASLQQHVQEKRPEARTFKSKGYYSAVRLFRWDERVTRKLS